MSKIMGADLLVRCLIRENVRFVFGIPGGQLCPILDGIRRLGHEAGLQFVMTHHEQAARMLVAAERPLIHPGAL